MFNMMKNSAPNHFIWAHIFKKAPLNFSGGHIPPQTPPGLARRPALTRHFDFQRSAPPPHFENRSAAYVVTLMYLLGLKLVIICPQSWSAYLDPTSYTHLGVKYQRYCVYSHKKNADESFMLHCSWYILWIPTTGMETYKLFLKLKIKILKQKRLFGDNSWYTRHYINNIYQNQ